MKSAKARKLLKEVPKGRRIFINKSTDLVVLVNSILKSNGIKKGVLANKLHKTPPEISKWLNGSHNFTLQTLCNLEAILGTELISIPRPVNINSDGKVFSTIVYKTETPHLNMDSFEKVKVAPDKTKKYSALAS